MALDGADVRGVSDVDGAEADVVEQELDAVPGTDEPDGPPEVPQEADPADVVEQGRPVPFDDEREH